MTGGPPSRSVLRQPSDLLVDDAADVEIRVPALQDVLEQRLVLRVFLVNARIEEEEEDRLFRFGNDRSRVVEILSVARRCEPWGNGDPIYDELFELGVLGDQVLGERISRLLQPLPLRQESIGDRVVGNHQAIVRLAAEPGRCPVGAPLRTV